MFRLETPLTKPRRRGLTFDTLRHYKRLRPAFTEEQAQALVEILVWQGCGPDCRYPACEGRKCLPEA